MTTTDLPITPLTRVRRLPDRQVSDRAALHAILDEALVAHVVTLRGEDPVAVPFAVARDGDSLLLHGSTGAGTLLRPGGRISVTVTLLDGLVVARRLFDNSMNYRSAVIFGVPEVLEGDEKLSALVRLTEQLLPGRWDELEAPNAKDLAATKVLRLSLDEASVKVRTGPPSHATEPADAWAGVVPLVVAAGAPEAHPEVPTEVPVPPSVHASTRRFQVSGQQTWAKGPEA